MDADAAAALGVVDVTGRTGGAVVGTPVEPAWFDMVQRCRENKQENKKKGDEGASRYNQDGKEIMQDGT